MKKVVLVLSFLSLTSLTFAEEKDDLFEKILKNGAKDLDLPIDFLKKILLYTQND